MSKYILHTNPPRKDAAHALANDAKFRTEAIDQYQYSHHRWGAVGSVGHLSALIKHSQRRPGSHSRSK